MIAVFAFLPFITRDVPDLDAVWTLCTMATGAFFGAYYGLHGTAWKGWRGVLPFVSVVLAACAPLIAANVFGGGFGGEMPTHLAAALGNVVAGAMGAVLGKNLGRLCPVCNNLGWRPSRKEDVVLIAIFTVSFAVVYAQCAVAGPFGGGDGVFQYAAPFLVAVTTVGGVSLGAIYGSYEVRYGVRLWFGAAVLVVLLVAILVSSNVPLAAAWTCGDGIDCPTEARSASTGDCADPPDWLVSGYMRAVHIWALAFAIMAVTMEMLGAELGAHYSARLQMRGGVD